MCFQTTFRLSCKMGHPTTNGNVDSANDYHILSCDASSFSNPPSTIDEPYIVARQVLEF